MDNSIKALTESKEKIIRISLRADKNELTINFSDSGCGIPIEKGIGYLVFIIPLLKNKEEPVLACILLRQELNPLMVECSLMKVSSVTGALPLQLIYHSKNNYGKVSARSH